jgi:hypothetical protein
MAGERHGRGMLCVNRPLEDNAARRTMTAKKEAVLWFCHQDGQLYRDGLQELLES